MISQFYVFFIHAMASLCNFLPLPHTYTWINILRQVQMLFSLTALKLRHRLCSPEGPHSHRSSSLFLFESSHIGAGRSLSTIHLLYRKFLIEQSDPKCHQGRLVLASSPNASSRGERTELCSILHQLSCH